MSTHESRLAYLLLYYNLGGEMIYILRQRLIAQNICSTKAVQVLNDIILSLVTSRDYCVNTFATSGVKISPNFVRTSFETIIGSSPLMRLTPSSFEKLFELMVGVFKYQVCLAPFPSSLHFVTWNHLTSLLALAEGISSTTAASVRRHSDEYLNAFQELNRSEWLTLRSLLLTNFFSGVRTRVSLLLREGCQDMDTGLFVIPAAGREYGDEDGAVDQDFDVRSTNFVGRITHYGDEGVVIEESGHFENIEERTQLGHDIYSAENEEGPESGSGQVVDQTNVPDEVTKSMDVHETALLATLLGRSEKMMNSELVPFDFEFNVGDDETKLDGDQSETDPNQKKPADIKGDSVASRVLKPTEFNVETNQVVAGDDQDDDDLLKLMDS